MSIRELARQAAAWFETAERPDGEKFTRLRDGYPQWVQDLVYTAHAGMLPDDYKYQVVADALEAIVEAGESTDLEDVGRILADDVDVYSSELIAWLEQGRGHWVDQARDEGLVEEDTDLDRRLMAGQYLERQEVFELVVQQLEKEERERADV